MEKVEVDHNDNLVRETECSTLERLVEEVNSRWLTNDKENL